MKRKIVFLFLVVVLISSVLLVPVSASSQANASETTTENLEVEPFAIPYPVDKPIHDTAFITNSQIGDILEQRGKHVGWFGIVTALGSMIPPFSSVGAANGVALAFRDMGESTLERAYRNGHDLYVAILNANGESSSLTKEAVLAPSQSTVIFQYYG
ncbi:hypothetical protein [Gracilibacillus timonensis]|uniref:hypothetical protein n=1 Tax=Gracilibacillus timonensis TaxID=1816696 RepID=UPI00082409D1|nr:hypothetical protein [Gracilibacillus timonensis]